MNYECLIGKIRHTSRKQRGLPSQNSECAVESAVALAELMQGKAVHKGYQARELVEQGLDACNSILKEQNNLCDDAVTRLILQECIWPAKQALREDRYLFTQLFGTEAARGRDYCLAPETEAEFHAFCLAIARGVPVRDALNPGGPEINGIKLWLMLGTMFSIAVLAESLDEPIA